MVELPISFCYQSSIPYAVRTPKVLLPLVWPLPRSLATTCGISVDFFSSPYLDVSVQAVPHVNLWIQLTLTEYCSAGFPHSEIFGLQPICGSPKLIAACRVLHRLSVPRHSPCALYSLTCSSQSPLRSASRFTASFTPLPCSSLQIQIFGFEFVISAVCCYIARIRKNLGYY